MGNPRPEVIIDGKAAAAILADKITADVAELRWETGLVPGLAVVLVGDDPASAVYVSSKHRQTIAAGMASFEAHVRAVRSGEVPAAGAGGGGCGCN